MSVIGSNIIAGASGVVADTGYQISRSLRFNSADSTSLSRTFGSGGSTTKWTKSIWLKRSTLGDGTNPPGVIFSAGTNSTNDMVCYITKDNTLDWFNRASSSVNARKITTQVFRDLSAWQHLLFVWDSANATAASRMLLYVNGVQVTTFSTSTDPSSSLASIWNGAVLHYMMRDTANSGYLSGYLADIYFVDGQALTPSSFGEIDANTGVWTPKAYTGTFGTTGYYLKLDDNSNNTAATLGKDSSGNGNNWTPNNLFVTAGVGNDSLVDSPTNYGTDTGAGGEVRGNYATLNPLRATATLANGNLQFTGPTSGGAQGTFATMGVTSGKWYFEVTPTTVAGTYYPSIGISTNESELPTAQPGVAAGGYMYMANGQKFVNNALSNYGASYAANDVIGVALDMDAGTITFYKNGVSQGQAYTGVTGTATPVLGNTGAATPSAGYINFGQRPFAYTAPSGFKALCTQNLPTPAIAKPSTNFNVVTYTGNGTSQSITGVGFQPDFTWVKNRSVARDHRLVDAVRGATKELYSNLTNAEATDANGLTAFSSDGFSVGSTTSYNGNTETFVAWNWKANGAGSSNTSGTISSTVSVNTTAGISVVAYTGNATAGATVGHGLGVAPAMIIAKYRGGVSSWSVYHKSLNATKWLTLNGTTAATTSAQEWNNTEPTSSVFSVGSSSANNNQAGTNIAYCFAEIAGFSRFGSYTGNASTDGPFVYCGFRPRFIMVKRTDAVDSWMTYDTVRNSYNIANLALYPNASTVETTETNNPFDILSNGFKLRGSGTTTNASNGTYIFAAFAEAPFNYARAR